MTWKGINILFTDLKCRCKKTMEEFRIDLGRIRRGKHTGICFHCREDLSTGKNVYKVHIESLQKENVCLCGECFAQLYETIT